LGILNISEAKYALIPGEYDAVTAGLLASSLIVAIYVAPLALSVKRVKEPSLDYRLVIALIATAVLAVSISAVVNSAIALTYGCHILACCYNSGDSGYLFC
jgi:pilus assembly protein TadC